MTIRIEVGGVAVEAEPGCSLGDLCHEHDLPVEFSCRGGACGTCLTRVLAGADNLSARSDNEEVLIPDFVVDDGTYRLACQAIAYGPVKLRWIPPHDTLRVG